MMPQLVARIALTATISAAALGAAPVPESIQALIDAGQWTAAREALAAAASAEADTAARDALLFEAERLRRVAMDFDLTEADVLDALREAIPDVTAEDVTKWREEGLLQAFFIEGEWRYFARDPSNLFRRSPEARARRGDTAGSRQQTDDEAERAELERHIQEVIRQARATGRSLVCPVRRRVHYRLSVNPDAVPPGETIRCWLLCPREEPHQTDFTMLASTPEEHFVAPPDTPQRTIYLEQPAAPAGEPTVFEVAYEYTAWASYRDIDPAAIEPCDPQSEVFRRYTAEEPPHIVFTPEIRALARELVGDETNPYLKAKRIFDWMNDNIRWISEREYSTIPNISELCLERRAGDCGVQAILFITLCRAAGVPARWESGWYPQPGRETMHDWARFYVEPVGWLWADPSKGYYPDFEGEEAQHFYFGNIDHFRLVANSAYSQPLVPPKQHFRSETVDFQRGEVEWRGGNLYFDQWDWDFESEDFPIALEGQ